MAAPEDRPEVALVASTKTQSLPSDPAGSLQSSQDEVEVTKERPFFKSAHWYAQMSA